MSIVEALQRLQDLPFPTEIRESAWLFPTIETVHVLALVLVVGSIAFLDLRLLGWTSRPRRITDLIAETLPWTWSAFAVAATSGALMFSSKAVTYYSNIPFRLKMLCLMLAGFNMIWFHHVSLRRVGGWDHGAPPASARIAGGLSMLLWITIVGAGRWIGFTT
jgi:hypothetical protein